MQELKAIVSGLENRKVQLEYELDYTVETFESLDEEAQSAFEGQIEKLKASISRLDFEIEEANKAIKELSNIKRQISNLEDEEDKIAPYKGAEDPKVQEIRSKSNELEDKYAELYNEILYRIQDL